MISSEALRNPYVILVVAAYPETKFGKTIIVCILVIIDFHSFHGIVDIGLHYSDVGLDKNDTVKASYGIIIIIKNIGYQRISECDLPVWIEKGLKKSRFNRFSLWMRSNVLKQRKTLKDTPLFGSKFRIVIGISILSRAICTVFK